MARIRFIPAKVEPGTDISDADAAIGDVKNGKTFYSVAEPRKTGNLATVAIIAGSSAYPAGYHAGNVGGLPAIDADLAQENIKDGVTIFNILGTYTISLSATNLVNLENQYTEIFDAWLTVNTQAVPAGAVLVVTSLAFTSTYPGSTNDGRVLYNGVEKCSTLGWGQYEMGFCGWEGDGLGSGADIVFQLKTDIGAGAYVRWGGRVSYFD